MTLLFNRNATKIGNRLKRQFRLEELERREFLDAAPYSPPAAINVGAVYHEDYYLAPSNQEDKLGDTFVVSWNGGAAGTKLTEFTIDLTTYDVDEQLYFNVSNSFAQGPNGALFPLTVTGDSDFNDGDFSISYSNNYRSLTVKFDKGIDFTADKVFKFNIDVNSVSSNSIEVVVPGAHFEKSAFSAKFESERYDTLTINKQFKDNFDLPPNANLNVPGDSWYDNNTTSRSAMTAGAIAAGNQTPLAGSISGYVYHDRNNDGIKAANDTGIADVWLALYYKDSNGDYVATGNQVQTNANGYYVFENIAGGRTYLVREVAQPDGYLDGKETPGTIDGVSVGEARPVDDIAEIYIGAKEHGIDYNFGEYKGATITGNVYEDDNNDGVRDDDENGIENVTIYLCEVLPDGTQRNITQTVTDKDGHYSFNNLDPSKTYCLTEIDPEGYCDGKNSIGTVNGVTVGDFKADPDAMTNIVLESGDDGINYNFAENRKGSLSGFVYIDADKNGVKDIGEAGLQNITLTLWVWNGSDYVATPKTVITDANGYYVFEGLCPFKRYQIREGAVTGYDDGEETVGSLGGDKSVNDIISNIDLPPNGHGTDYNFGELMQPVPGSISGYVYLDANKDGVRNVGESGISGVTVKLEKLVNGNYVAVAETVTNADGYYTFAGLDPEATYRVLETQPTAYNDGAETVGSLGGDKSVNDIISGIFVGDNQHGTDYNFGELIPPVPGSISGYVYLDANKDGVKNVGESGISGVTVRLEKLVNGNYVAVTEMVTNADGYYIFAGLDPEETYRVLETQPTAYNDGAETVGSLGGDKSVNDIISGIFVGDNQHGTDYNFGELVIPPPLVPGSISGYVYLDVNKDGVKNVGESGISGVTVRLEKLVNGSYIAIAETVTNADGYYIFTNLIPSETYRVLETQPAAYDDGAETVGSLGGDKSVNDVISGIIVGDNQHGTDYNFGELEKELPPPPKPVPGSISGYVYLDVNKDGIRNGGDTGISGVTVKLEKLVNGSYVAAAETVTNADGYYNFVNLNPNETYRVVEVQPENYDDGAETVGSLGGDKSVNDIISGIVVGENQYGTDYNFGELAKDVPPPPPEPIPGSISGYVYFDANEDGIKNGNDTGINGVTVYLEKLVNGKYVRILSTLTNANGYYIFANLIPNETYRVVEKQPSNYKDGEETVGSLGGNKSVNDVISGIFVGDDRHGTGYNFGELSKALPPPTIENPPTPPGFTRLGRIGGYGGSAGTPGATSWQAPNLGESIRAGYGGSGSAVPNYAWHLSVINGGYPRENGNSDGLLTSNYSSQTTQILAGDDVDSSRTRYVSVAWTPLPMSQSGWYVRDKSGKVRKMYTFGPDGGIPLAGDFNGDGIDELAVYHNGSWYIDINGNGLWDEEDLWSELGSAGDQPVVGDWDGDGKADIGIFGRRWSSDDVILKDEAGLPSDLNTTSSVRPKNVPPNVTIARAGDNVRAMKHSQNGGVRLDVIDHVFEYGKQGDRGFTGDFSGDGVTKIGVYRDGKWYIDRNGNGRWDDGDIFIDNAEFGLGVDGIPVVGDFNGDGIANIGLYINGIWHLDTTGDFKFDTKVEFGQAGDYPVVGDFTGNGIAQLAVYRAGSNESLQAMDLPQAAPAQTTGYVASQFTGDEASQRNTDQGALPEKLQHHSRSAHTPHSNAPLHR